MEYFEQCEEIYGHEAEELRLMGGTFPGETVTFISPNMLIKANVINGQLVRAAGTVVKAEQVELNHVKVTKGEEVMFFELSETVRWMEVE
jgi:hypothetical protein